MTLQPPADSILVQSDDFDVASEYQQLCTNNPDDGAVVFFVGRVRDLNDGDQVQQLELQHYPGMTEKALGSIVADARQRWQLGRVRLIHRVGPMNVEDQIVFVGVSSPHRGNAFDAAAFIMDFLKSRAPFWKKERILDGQGQTQSERWVEARDSDQQALQRWQADS
ncbi:molybdopterin synthase catalytic subunit MoaE [Oceanobacter mangrovi]|uniref:molybdopterin synthase catalytic subunit MoaE n=1 Tax=Oceanobacter mangrovi TaxID=2862510 RepID=UPI001C8DFA4F|nr:molybdopterin synthase catalytic subunit MoaE [Oceanobacter mangrovi]